ncbi:sigma-70 family RNA polymerase sigma factor [Corynebacterium sp. 4HC-13]|uniref:RNA polymerase sigma factor n=1 Tax=Corynebacterium anserum TaxID=2684406 RepID=UPI0016397CC0|nr:RNA polymerase sigma factor [Corynebacterium anserum]MBC2682556.1 sigma-70 family RNA polymerase sigma factor [Corynebacterium anserum]
MSTQSTDDQRTFTQTYTQAYPKVLAYMRRRSDIDAAADLTAEVFVRAWNSRSQLFHAHHQLAWLYGIARNVLLEYYRRSEHTQTSLRTDTDDSTYLRSEFFTDVTQTSESTFAAPDETALVNTTLDIRQALSTLAPADQEILTLHAWEGLDSAELAEALDIGTSAARVRLHRARARLSVALNGVEEAHKSKHTNSNKGAR